MPLAPDAPQQAGAAADAVALSWAPPHANGAPISGYTLEVDDGRGGPFVLAYSGTATSATVGGLRVRRRKGGCGGGRGGGRQAARWRMKSSCVSADPCAGPAAAMLPTPSPLPLAPTLQSGLEYRFRLLAENQVGTGRAATHRHACGPRCAPPPLSTLARRQRRLPPSLASGKARLATHTSTPPAAPPCRRAAATGLL